MSYTVVYSFKAAQQLRDLKSFLRKKWNDKVVISFLDELEESIHHFQQKPSMYPVFSKRKNIRRCVIKRRTLLLYQVIPAQKEILIVYIGDTRKDPDKISV